MSKEKITMKPVDDNAPEILRKVSAFIGGSRTTRAQVELLLGGVTILIGVLRQIIGDKPTNDFLNGLLLDIKLGKKPAFPAQIVTKH